MATATAPRRKRPRAVRSPLTDAQQELATRYIPMAAALARPLKLSWQEHAEEFHCAAMLALVEAAQSFDPTRGVKFPTFARYRIWGALRDVQRGLILAGFQRDDDLRYVPSLSSLGFDSEEHGTVVTAKPVRSSEEAVDALDWVLGMFRCLHGNHLAVARSILVDGLTQGQTADRMGLSKSRVSYLYKEARELLREEYDRRNAVTA